MLIEMMTGKIHRATVTEADLKYMGSITIDSALMEAAGFIANQKVQVVNNHNGARFVTYVIPGERNSGIVCLNGAAARLVHTGDIVIIIAYGLMSQVEAQTYQPRVVFVDKHNKVMSLGQEFQKQEKK